MTETDIVERLRDLLPGRYGDTASDAIAEIERLRLPAQEALDSDVIEKIVREYFDSALRWEPVFEDGRGSNNLKIWETNDLLCMRFMRAIKRPIPSAFASTESGGGGPETEVNEVNDAWARGEHIPGVTR